MEVLNEVGKEDGAMEGSGVHTVSCELNEVEFSIETGRFARLADGAVMVRQGGTMVLVTAVSGNELDLDFLPLTVDYREQMGAAGKIPGGFFKREAKPSDKEILSARLIDRPCRPMFPKGWRKETQVIATVFSHDQEFDADVLAATGASAALMLSSIPFNGPISEVRIGRVEGEWIVNPRVSQLEYSDFDMVVAGTDESIVMVEGSYAEVSEDDFVAALEFAHHHIRRLNALQRELVARAGKEKQEYQELAYPEALVSEVQQRAKSRIEAFFAQPTTKAERSAFRKELKAELVEYLQTVVSEHPEYEDVAIERLVGAVLSELEREVMRRRILEEGIRVDGRKLDEIRPISIEVGLLPRTHGSALFTRGETQSLATATLGTKFDEQVIEGLLPTYTRRFMLHYNFPPYSTNEVRRMGATSRREIGHGYLAERALEHVIPPEEEFPYTIRVVSDILMSNGSSSMATVCSGSLALMDAGVPIRKPVSGIAMGLIMAEDGRYAVLSDILGDEDMLGDMDFKVAGTRDGITACQMDIKVQGISYEIIRKALEQAKRGRLFILEKMNAVLEKPRPELSPYAPRIWRVPIPPEMIGAVIGPGGSTIRSIAEDTGTEIFIEQEGIALIYAPNEDAARKAEAIIKELVKKPEVGEVYEGVVREIREGLGALVEFLPNKVGLLHISQIDYRRIQNVGDVLAVGDKVKVKLIAVQDGKYRLSRKELLPPPTQTSQRGGHKASRHGSAPQRSSRHHPRSEQKPRGNKRDLPF